MLFDPKTYGDAVAALLSLDGCGERLMPLVGGQCACRNAWQRLRDESARELFPRSRAPEAARAGLYLYFSCLDEAHAVVQEDPSAEAAFWHGILHRQEPDPGNSAYWFRRVGAHPVFPALRRRAAEIVARHAAEVTLAADWDPFAFIDLCEQARAAPGSKLESVALEIQRAEWQFLFDYCARPAR